MTPADLTPIDCVRALAPVVLEGGARWMLHPDTIAVGKAAGYANGFLFYGGGRGGVLGDVDADVVAAGFGFFNPVLVRQIWGPAIAVEGARKAARRYGEACAAFGRARLGGVEGMDRLAALAERVIDAGNPSGLSLFAGWRAEPRPDDAVGRAALALHVLRELRGSVHIVAVAAHGLSPLEAIVAEAGGGGAERAALFGWGEPFPDPAPLMERRAAAEAMTDALLVPWFAVLDPAERAELVERASAARAALVG